MVRRQTRDLEREGLGGEHFVNTTGMRLPVGSPPQVTRWGLFLVRGGFNHSDRGLDTKL